MALFWPGFFSRLSFANCVFSLSLDQHFTIDVYEMVDSTFITLIHAFVYFGSVLTVQ